MTITEKQLTGRKVTQTIYIPLPLAVRIDEQAERLGISRSELINRYLAQGVTNNNGQ